MAKIFQELQGNYGSRFLNQWKTGQVLQDGIDAGVVNAMATWGKKLAGFSDKPECIRRVLDSLPVDPPSLPQFVELCRAARPDEKTALPHKLTREDHDRISKAARDAKRAVDLADMDKIEFWATHPRSNLHLRFIFDAAKNDDRFDAFIGDMVVKGICTKEGNLLKAYSIGGWTTVKRVST